MRTNTSIVCPSEIAIVAKDLKPVWVVFTDEPAVEFYPSLLQIDLCTVFVSIAVDVVHGEESGVGFSAARALSAVVVENVKFDLTALGCAPIEAELACLLVGHWGVEAALVAQALGLCVFYSLTHSALRALSICAPNIRLTAFYAGTSNRRDPRYFRPRSALHDERDRTVGYRKSSSDAPPGFSRLAPIDDFSDLNFG